VNRLLHIDLRVGETLRVGEALLTLAAKSGQRARLTVCAPRSITITPHCAQECAPLPDAKEHSHGKHPL
jgi:hypothetical protein